MLDELAAGQDDETIDLIQGFAYPLPLVVIFELLGVPEERRGPFHRIFGAIMSGPFIPESEFVTALEEMVVLMRAVVADKRHALAEDLLSALIAVRDHGDRLTDDELTSTMYILVVAGHNHHLAFGHGVHHCLGATLARIEGRIALGEIVARFPHLELVEPPAGLRTRPNPLINGLAELPVRLGRSAS